MRNGFECGTLIFCLRITRNCLDAAAFATGNNSLLCLKFLAMVFIELIKRAFPLFFCMMLCSLVV
jgi:hypothetical protein